MATVSPARSSSAMRVATASTAVVLALTLSACSAGGTSASSATTAQQPTETAGSTVASAEGTTGASISKVNGLQAKACLAALRLVSSAPRYEASLANQAEAECKKATDALMAAVEAVPAYAQRGPVDLNDPHGLDMAPYGPAGELYDVLVQLDFMLKAITSILGNSSPNDHSADLMLRAFVDDDQGLMKRAEALASRTS